MKEWFKYEFGYVNIDSKNLYLTNSGNWSETENLQEKTKTVESKNSRKKYLVIGYITVVFCIFAILLLKNIVSGKIAITMTILIVFGGYSLYEYLKSEIGSKFKIPFDKITEIKVEDNRIEISFINGDGNNDTYQLEKVDEKGIATIKSIK